LVYFHFSLLENKNTRPKNWTAIFIFEDVVSFKFFDESSVGGSVVHSFWAESYIPTWPAAAESAKLRREAIAWNATAE